MTTRARTEANRQNARRSTGPWTRSGKARVARNALRHGLAVPVATLPEYDGAIKQLTADLVGNDASKERFFAASQIAEATIDLRRVRAVKRVLVQELIAQIRGAMTGKLASTTAALTASLMRLERYERRACSRQKTAMRVLDVLDLSTH